MPLVVIFTSEIHLLAKSSCFRVQANLTGQRSDELEHKQHSNSSLKPVSQGTKVGPLLLPDRHVLKLLFSNDVCQRLAYFVLTTNKYKKSDGIVLKMVWVLIHPRPSQKTILTSSLCDASHIKSVRLVKNASNHYRTLAETQKRMRRKTASRPCVV